MYTKLQMELDSNNINVSKSSNMQGVLYENINSEYVSKLHISKLHPYSQSLVKENDKVIWSVKTLTDESKNNIINVLLEDKFNEFKFRNNNQPIKIISKQITELSEEELLKEFYDIKANDQLNIRVLTPMSFKRNGKYVNYPDLRLIYQSLMNRYSSISEGMDMYDTDTLDQLVDSTYIASYNLRSTKFPLEGITIPSFVGWFSIRINGNETLARYLRMLFRFGTYSGVGIKTGIGMGAIEMYERGK